MSASSINNMKTSSTNKQLQLEYDPNFGTLEEFNELKKGFEAASKVDESVQRIALSNIRSHLFQERYPGVASALEEYFACPKSIEIPDELMQVYKLTESLKQGDPKIMTEEFVDQLFQVLNSIDEKASDIQWMYHIEFLGAFIEFMEKNRESFYDRTILAKFGFKHTEDPRVVPESCLKEFIVITRKLHNSLKFSFLNKQNTELEKLNCDRISIILKTLMQFNRSIIGLDRIAGIDSSNPMVFGMSIALQHEVNALYRACREECESQKFQDLFLNRVELASIHQQSLFSANNLEDKYAIAMKIISSDVIDDGQSLPLHHSQALRIFTLYLCAIKSEGLSEKFKQMIKIQLKQPELMDIESTPDDCLLL